MPRATTIEIDNQEVKVFLVSRLDFPLGQYQQYLQQMADRSLRLKKWTLFGEATRTTPPGIKSPAMETDAWFDLRNDAFWVLTKKD